MSDSSICLLLSYSVFRRLGSLKQRNAGVELTNRYPKFLTGYPAALLVFSYIIDSVPICYDQCRQAGTFRDFSDRHPADIWSGKRINRKTGVGKMAHRPHTLRGTPDKTNRRMKSPNQSVSPSVFPSSQSRTIESTCGPYLAMKTFPIPFMSDNSFSLRGSTRHTVTRAICCMIT
mgnify:CR=1 FL=1